MNQTFTASEVIPSDYQFNLSDFALFLSVMRNKEAYEAVLSIIMDDNELTLTEVKVEQVILNKSGNRAIRLDAPILKSGKNTKYKELPSTIIIFITQADIFKKDLAMYTFTEQCEEIADLKLEDGTTKIFLNMTSKNGRPELISLLQYMKHTKINDSELSLYDKRIQKLNSIVNEVLDSTEWEAVKSNILEIGLAKGQEIGFEIGLKQGHEQGMAIKLKEQISRKIQKGKSAEIIAVELEEELDVILPLYHQLISSSS